MKTLEQLGISPAPWKHTPADEWTHAGIDDANGCGVGETYQVAHRDETAETANARLMAATPELYEALRMYQEAFAEIRKSAWFLDANFHEIMCLNKVMTAADAALAKAAGESEVKECITEYLLRT